MAGRPYRLASHSKGFISGTLFALFALWVYEHVNPKSSGTQKEDVFDFPDFAQLAQKFVTDKLEHGYSPGYQRYIPLATSNLKGRPMRFLEIGLGCGMQYGPGHSVPLWKSFLPPTSEITILEFNATCGSEWYSQTAYKDINLVFGSSNDTNILRKLNAEYGPFHVVVDDGAHLVEHQRTAFQVLFPPMPSGGVFFMEDVHTSYSDQYQGADLEKQKDTALTMTTQIMNNLFYGRVEFKIDKTKPPPKDDPVVVATYDHILSMDIHDTMVIFVHK
mmetsp:Transcript_26704/g.43651  ORF Transcript_26704/g.43651 Transcript_26704/m.43651 type:complete len:275 (-) Transcript_26704:1299-2123(-)